MTTTMTIIEVDSIALEEIVASDGAYNGINSIECINSCLRTSAQTRERFSSVFSRADSEQGIAGSRGYEETA